MKCDSGIRSPRTKSECAALNRFKFDLQCGMLAESLTRRLLLKHFQNKSPHGGRFVRPPN